MEKDSSKRDVQETSDDVNPQKKKRTRRGLTLRSPLKCRGNEDVSIPIYNSRIDSLREEKKKKIATVLDFEFHTNQCVDCEIERDVTNLSENNDEIEDLDDSQAPLSPPKYYPTEIVIGPRTKAGKLLAKLESDKNKFELEMIQERLNKTQAPIIDDCDCLFVDTNREFFLKIRWKLKIQKIRVKYNQPFQSIFEKFSEMVNEPRGKLIFIFNDSLIKHSDTPIKLGITISDIIDCGLLSSNLTSKEKNTDLMTFKLQSKDMKKKIEISILKTDTISTLIKKFAEQQKIKEKKIILQFDGESLSENQTPIELELENDFCIDVIIR